MKVNIKTIYNTSISATLPDCGEEELADPGEDLEHHLNVPQYLLAMNSFSTFRADVPPPTILQPDADARKI